MSIFDEKIDELLAKRLAGECSPEEDETLERWLAESAEHRRHLEELQWLWERSSDALAPAPRPVDTEAALLRVKSRLKAGGGAQPLRWQRSFWMRAAAVFLLAVAGVYWWQSGNTPAPVRIAAAGSVLTDTLTDGSVVTLERQSGLTLARQFNRRERRLRLEGEAFFDVAPDTARPFIVEVQELEVRVVGTEFTVDNTTDPAKVIVTVTEGKVLVASKARSVLLQAGEQAVFDRQNGTLQRTARKPDQGVFGNRLLMYNATPLSKVVEDVNTRYGARVRLGNKVLENCLLNARYNNLPLERLLELIAESFSLTVKKEGDAYVLDGEGCGE
ncbi:MAG: FecR domain-containing protein [Thermoanaerobaculia bacterium]|nr:FecR domain-containing protein [Thermoanaerobaculia bacterium]